MLKYLYRNFLFQGVLMTQKRKPASYRLKPITIQKIKDMADFENTSQGRIIDNIVGDHTKGDKDARKNKK